jgi:hypothetical protein
VMGKWGEGTGAGEEGEEAGVVCIQSESKAESPSPSLSFAAPTWWAEMCWLGSMGTGSCEGSESQGPARGEGGGM